MTPPEADSPRIGNRYRLEERIGAGAMGAVWRGTDELLNRTVAVKELIAAAPTSGGPDAAEESRQRLLREGRIGARLQHAHVISMFDVVVHDDRPWLIMEYLPSRSLAAVLGEKGPMEPLEAAAIGRQVADGLAAAHAAGVVHRDIKPGNVLIAEDGRAKISDFGVSRAVDDVQLTRTGMIAGTPAFLAPEVARGQEPTSASDVFALGATLYAAVEGGPPFGLDDNAYALLHKVATGAVRPPRHAGVLTALLMRLLANEPADRPTASQALDALAAISVDTSVVGLIAASASAHTAPAQTASTQAGPGWSTPAPSIPAQSTPGRNSSARTPDRAAPDQATPARTSGPGPGGAPAADGRSRIDEHGPRTLTDLPVLPVPPPGPGGGGGRPRRRRLVPILIVLVVLLVVGGGIVIGALRASNGSVAEPPASTVPTTEPAAPAPPTGSAVATGPDSGGAPTTGSTPPSTTARATTTPSAPPPAAGADAVGVVQNYYGLLPDDPDTAFARLGAPAQAASGGMSGYRAFWSGIRSVSVQGARSTGQGQVSATIVFTRTNGSTSSEPYTFRVNDQLIQSFSRA